MHGTAHPALAHVDHWVFDLDKTLYPSGIDLWGQVDRKIGDYIAGLLNIPFEAARGLQKDYFRRYGTTMKGLMVEYGIDPAPFLDFVHGIDYAPIAPDPALDAALAALPGPKYVFTNASVGHAERVLARAGIAHHFVDLFDIVAAKFRPKPSAEFYDDFLARHGIDPARAALFEDMAKNLKPAHERGMTTILVETDDAFCMDGHEGEHVHHRTRSLPEWLAGVAAARRR